MTVKHFNCHFEVKKATKGMIVIEGLANAATVDRMKEIIDPKGWNLDNYKKNPVVLFDHGHDPAFGFMPIGKAIDVRPTDEGLFTKIQISSSKSEKISAVRDLVEEGILKTFSVGFDPKESEKSADNPDVVIIKKAELIETSIVPIPMNQDSTFSLLKKRKAYWKTPFARRWYDSYLDKVSNCKKGAWVAAAVNQRMFDLMETGEIRNNEAALKLISNESGCSMHDVKSALNGDMAPVPPSLLSAFATVLRIDSELLSNLNQGDIALLERVLSREEVEMGQKTGDAPKVKMDAPEMVIHAIMVPKEAVDSVDAAASMVSAAGYSVEAVSESDSAYVFTQIPDDQVDLENATILDMGNGVIAHIAPGMAKAADAEEEAPAEDAQAEDEQAVADEAKSADEKAMTPEEITAMNDAYSADMQAAKDGTVPAWVSDEALWQKAVEASSEVVGEVSAEFVMWLYLNQGGGKKSFEPSIVKGVGTVGDDNPYLELSRQANTLLGTLVNEIQNMSKKLDGVADMSLSKAENASADTTTVDATLSKDDGMAKSLDLFQGYKRELEHKLKSLNV